MIFSTELITEARLAPLSASSLSSSPACCSAGSTGFSDGEGSADGDASGAGAETDHGGPALPVLSSFSPPLIRAPAPRPITAQPTTTAAPSASFEERRRGSGPSS